jgi:hypothetical protein
MAQAVPFQFSSCRHAVLCCAGADVGLDEWLCVTLILAAEETVKLCFSMFPPCCAVLCCAGADVGLDKWLCVTLILAAEATVKLPKIRSLAVSNSLHAYC